MRCLRPHRQINHICLNVLFPDLSKFFGRQSNQKTARSAVFFFGQRQKTARSVVFFFDSVTVHTVVHTESESCQKQWHADVRASAAMIDDNNDDAEDGDFDDTLGEILVASFMATPSLDLDLALGAVDSNVDLACTRLLSPPFPLSPPLPSAPSSAAAGEPF